MPLSLCMRCAVGGNGSKLWMFDHVKLTQPVCCSRSARCCRCSDVTCNSCLTCQYPVQQWSCATSDMHCLFLISSLQDLDLMDGDALTATRDRGIDLRLQERLQGILESHNPPAECRAAVLWPVWSLIPNVAWCTCDFSHLSEVFWLECIQSRSFWGTRCMLCATRVHRVQILHISNRYCRPHDSVAAILVFPHLCTDAAFARWAGNRPYWCYIWRRHLAAAVSDRFCGVACSWHMVLFNVGFYRFTLVQPFVQKLKQHYLSLMSFCTLHRVNDEWKQVLENVFVSSFKVVLPVTPQ